MSVFNLRLYAGQDTPKDTQNMSNKLINWGTDASAPVFSTETNSKSAFFKPGDMITDKDDDIKIDIAGDFVIAFWAKFTFAGETLASFTNKYLILVFEDGTSVKFEIPYTTYNVASRDSFKYYCVTRKNGAINFYIDGTQVGSTVTNTGELNLNSKSVVYLGNPYGTTTDENVIADDVLIMDTYDTSFVGVESGTKPTTYYSTTSSYTPPVPYLVIPASGSRMFVYIY